MREEEICDGCGKATPADGSYQCVECECDMLGTVLKGMEVEE